MSNAGNNGSNRILPRRQLLANGTETDACSGNILKHHHAALLAEYCAARGMALCPACARQDGRRAAALVNEPRYKDRSLSAILEECVLCDTHGFLVPAKNAPSDGTAEARQKLSKHSLVEFSFALALPNYHAETTQFITRQGDSKEAGQMLMKVPARSGAYALCVRYRAVGIGVDTDKWTAAVTDEAERKKRHQATLEALRDQLLSPLGALTSTMLPHLTGLIGAVVVRSTVGRAPLYSALADDFIERLVAIASPTCHVLSFDSIEQFSSLMERLIDTTVPCTPTPRPVV
ncbi:MAG: hypothetical protein M3R24_06910 [Chloroflexota bacterium]|nr:hypothetical protein [Chloroflexota bacterium]